MQLNISVRFLFVLRIYLTGDVQSEEWLLQLLARVSSDLATQAGVFSQIHAKTWTALVTPGGMAILLEGRNSLVCVVNYQLES